MWTRKALEQRDALLVLTVQRLRSSPHWPALAKMMNLPEGA